MIGFAITGSFCTFSKVFKVLKDLSEEYEIVPIMSETTYKTDTRFGKAEDNIDFIEKTTGKKVIKTIKEAEPIGPKKLFDALIIAPCTGNTIAKIANGIADTSVTLSAKSHLRNKRPVIIAVSTNDGLGNNAKNIGTMLNMKNIYFVPFGQDDYVEKENSLVADFDKIPETLEMSLKGKQLQPIIL